jgi:hypothetical protein
VASVNNLRRWDQRLPSGAVRALTPVAHGAERVLQRVGRGWWGPSQFLLATRRTPVQFAAAPLPSGLDERLAAFAARTCCPNCRSDLDWTADEAACSACQRTYRRDGAFWDFAG